MIRWMILSLAVAFFAGAAPAEQLGGNQTYELLFKNGTLDQVDKDKALIYRREVHNTLTPDASTRDTGQVSLRFEEADTGATMAMLEFRRDEKHRSLGTFPASVGNPIIMYFYESVVRDMAEAAGGSPFYIRNRVKEALIAPSEIAKGEAVFAGQTISTQTILLRPFEGDPNVQRMQGFGDLELRITMSDAVPGWYVSFAAEAQGGDVYSSVVSFDHLEDYE